jgi:RHS repeat-associated protein
LAKVRRLPWHAGRHDLGRLDLSKVVFNRYYDPTTDQFLSVDPKVSQTDQPYVFTGDSPLNATDPLGLFRAGIGGQLCGGGAHPTCNTGNTPGPTTVRQSSCGSSCGGYGTAPQPSPPPANSGGGISGWVTSAASTVVLVATIAAKPLVAPAVAIWQHRTGANEVITAAITAVQNCVIGAGWGALAGLEVGGAGAIPGAVTGCGLGVTLTVLNSFPDGTPSVNDTNNGEPLVSNP